jgi:hypothetical protein
MPRTDDSATPEEYWSRVRSRFTRHFLEFREETAAPPDRRPKRLPAPSLVGPWAGRVWEVGFQAPRTFYPDAQVGFTTAARLVQPAKMPSEYLPWVYAGERPRVFSQSHFDFDRIVMRYRRREGNFKGTLTGDAELDRRWGIYPYENDLAGVFHEPKVVEYLRGAAAVSPDPKKLLPTFAVFGTEATFTLPVRIDPDNIPGVVGTFEGFEHILDRLELTRGGISARQRPIPMDVLRDERGVAFPIPRFDCPLCQQSTHPRYQVNLESEVCEKCGGLLYRWK